MLNLFYQEPDPDRFLKFDRYPRRIVRRVIRGKRQPGGQERVFLNLCEGLRRLGVRYRVNDYAHARRYPDELVCIVGKPHVLDVIAWRNPILFGAAVFSHPVDDPNLFRRLPVRRILVPGEWIRRMFEPYYGDKVVAWPVGIDTDLWKPLPAFKDVDVLLYDKVRWEHDAYRRTLIAPIEDELRKHKLRSVVIRYGRYRESDYHQLLQRARAMVFLCEHETQGIAYQQALSSNVPIFAWDRGGLWQDPSYYPEKVQFGPVSSVPYWDECCGMKFEDAGEFSSSFKAFWSAVILGQFEPRRYILEHLTLERCASRYLEMAQTE